MEASAPDGAALEACPGSWFDPVPDDQRITVDLREGEVAIWGAIAPALTVGQPTLDPGKVHVHHRPLTNSEKDIDGSFDIVTVVGGENELIIEGMAAVAYSISELAGQTVVPLVCPHCGQTHIDEQKFATNPHSKHLCNSCGRNFRDTSGTSISNPLANVYSQLGIDRPPEPSRAGQEISLLSDDFQAIALWPSNEALLSTMTRSEDVGIHVHAWSHQDEIVVDETYDVVSLDQEVVDPTALRWLAVQSALAHGASILAQACGGCGQSMTSPTEGWIEPRTSHQCVCGATTRTRRKVFLNPLANKLS
jgi:predicted RNA-binding Zn-ribbon protein involved in translation (DUF1610 family)